ncbi:META domain-containing protein [Qipengyuania aquimaris]|uniref:META domain-containing protein n=1 Tax=Qipengyuania aquimaris TaxID=255984 RepID=UPI001C982F98|nr:META domain-containing protein [Qipengyuania aquimaris]MBY6127944.1 META domain-containing protein [Qipengyuania aquimaris]
MARSRLNTVLMLGAAALLLPACEGILGFGEETVLDDTSWSLFAIRENGVSTRLDPDLRERHGITFESDGALYARLDCNRGQGRWSARETGPESGTIIISGMTSTRAFCPRPSFGEQMATELPSATDFEIAPRTGRLRVITRDATYIFQRSYDR